MGANVPISIHSTARVETCSWPMGQPMTVFQSTPPRGWRPEYEELKAFLHPISIHSTARVETDYLMTGKDEPKISIHSTARVETNVQTATQVISEFQSTPPRGWRPGRLVQLQNLPNFNPLHREGGDARTKTISGRHTDFNPLHREGGDLASEYGEKFTQISIHSTARVETGVFG